MSEEKQKFDVEVFLSGKETGSTVVIDGVLIDKITKIEIEHEVGKAPRLVIHRLCSGLGTVEGQLESWKEVIEHLACGCEPGGKV